MGRKITTRHLTTLILLTVASTHLQVNAGDLKVKPKVNSTLYHYNSQFGNSPSDTEQALVLIPSLLGTYESQYFESSLSVKHTNVQQTSKEEGADKSYNDIKYNGRLTLIDRMLFLSVSGGQSYQSIDEREAGLVDKVLRPGNLSKTQQNGAILAFATPKPQYLGLELKGSYSTSDSDRSTDELATNLSNENINYQARLYQGEQFNRVAWDFSFTNTNTSRTNFRDFESTSANGYASIGLFTNIRLILTASDEDYNFGDSGLVNAASNTIDTTSYGGGFEWYSNNNNRIAITYNQLDEGQESTTNYVGVSSKWAFSSRTDLQFEYGKRFFGDSYNVNFNYNTKHFRSKLRYSEDVSSFARLSTSTEDAGLFVCTIGATELSECFQPDSLQYELQAGEEFRPVEMVSPEISEQVFLRKTGGLSLGYSLRKLKVVLDVGVNKTDYLESTRARESRNAKLSATYKLGQRTEIGVGASFARNDFSGDSSNNREDEVTSSNISFSRTLSNKLKVSALARYLHRDSNSSAADMSDRRVTVSLDYTF